MMENYMNRSTHPAIGDSWSMETLCHRKKLDAATTPAGLRACADQKRDATAGERPSFRCRIVAHAA